MRPFFYFVAIIFFIPGELHLYHFTFGMKKFIVLNSVTRSKIFKNINCLSLLEHVKKSKKE